MAGRNEVAKATIYLDGKQAESALAGLKHQAEELRKALKQAQDAGDQVKMNKIQRELTGIESAQKSLRKETYDYQKVLKNLNGASLSELKKSLRTIEVQMNNLKRTDPGYATMKQQALLFRGEINKVNASMREQQTGLGKIADGFNKYFGVITAATAGFAAVSMVVGQTIKDYAAFDDKLADVMKTTGLTKDQVVSLNEELKKIDTRSSQEDLLDLARVAGKLGISAEADVLGFVRAADKINVALAEDLGGNTEQAINELGKLVDIFKLNEKFGMEDSLIKIGSAINSLGAAGTASELYLVEFSKRMAGIAPSAGISVQQVLGLAATLDELGQSSEVAGTAMTQAIGAMFKDTATYAGIAGMSVQDFTTILNTDANEALIKVLQGAKGSGTGFAEMAKNLDQLGLDGARSTAVLSVLANNIDKLREKQAFANDEFAKGTSLQKEFDTKNTTVQAKLDKARKSFAELGRELGEKLMPAYASIISKSKLMIATLITIIDFISKYGMAIMVTAVSIGAYTVAVKVAANWTKIQAAYTVTASAVETAYGVVKDLLTGKIKLATVAQKAWNLAMKANPIGLLIGILAGAVTWLISFENKTGKVSQALNKAGDFVIDLANQFVELYNASLPVRVAVNYLVSTIKTGFTAAKAVVQSFWEQLKLGGQLLKAVLSFDLDGIKKAFIDYSNNMKSTVINSAKEIADTWETGFNNAMNGKLKPITREFSTSIIPNASTDVESPAGLPEPEKNSNPTVTSEDFDNFLKAKPSDQKEAFKNHFNDIGADNYEVLRKEFEEKALKEPDKEKNIKSEKEKKREEEVQENLKFSEEDLELYLETEEQKLNHAKVKYAVGIINEKQYQAEITKIRKEAEEKRYHQEMQRLERHKAIADMASNLVDSMMEYELEKAGDNEEKKAKIRKKYALLQFATSASQIIIDTATAVTKALAELGPIAGPIAAALVAATGAVQLGIARAEMSKVKGGYAEGGYTGDGNKYEPAGMVHKGEWVAPREMVKSPQFAPMISWLEISRKAGNFHRVNIPDMSGSRQGYASGGYVKAGQTGADNQVMTGMTGEQAEALTAAINNLQNWKPRVYTELIKKDLEILEHIERNSKL